MAERKENLLELLVDAPWWVSVMIAVLVFMLFRFILPAVAAEASLPGVLAGALSSVAWLIALIVLVPAPVSAYNTWKKKRLLSGTEDMSALTKLSRRAFAQLVQEVYVRNGYQIKQYAEPGDKAEVDLIVEKAGVTVLVQYRHYKSGSIEEQTVQAILERLEKQEAQKAHIISSRGFSEQAAELARDSRISLLDMDSLAAMVHAAKA